MSARGLSLRSILAVTTTLVVMLCLLVAGSLVSLTTILHRTTANAAIAVESVRLAQEAEIDLLLHERARNTLVRSNLEQGVYRRLVAAGQLVSTEEEARAVTEARSKAVAYFTTARDTQALAGELEVLQDEAYRALEALVDLNVAFARQAQATAAAWDKRANYLGIGVNILVVAVAVGVLVWLRRRAFVPVFSLLMAMERFGQGDRNARARESGPLELREMSRRFNELAAALALQREAQIAFLGGVAHDLRNPLSVLQLSVALIASDKPLPPEPQLRRLIDKIRSQITRLERMVNDFLDIARIEAGELELKLDTGDARELVTRVVELFEGTPSEPHIIVSLPDGPVELRCDSLRIEQILTNLISNAIKYSPPASAIEVAVDASADAVCFRVTDHGVGIDKDERQQVFEPFRRVGQFQGAVTGVGLGLFVVRRIIEAHHGSIEVESTPGAGSTFRAYLPRRTA